MGGIGAKFTSLEHLCAELSLKPAQLIGCGHKVDHHVRYKHEPKAGGGTREICAPSESLKAIQRQIKDVLLKPYEYPGYVFGLGGDTLRQHAEVHRGDNKLVKVDIRNFFPSIHHTKVYEMWHDLHGFKPELARLLTRLTTHKGCLQQGFPTSSHIAAIVAQPATTQLAEYSASNGLNFSQYVDDLNFSGQAVDYRGMFKLVVEAIRSNGFTVKPSKTTVYNVKTGKTITGVSLMGNRTRAPRKTRRKAVDALKAYAANPESNYNANRAAGYGTFLGHLNKDDGDQYQQLLDQIPTSE